jgi:hypothetical protein
MEFDQRDRVHGFRRLDWRASHVRQQDHHESVPERDIHAGLHRYGRDRSTECFGYRHLVDNDNEPDANSDPHANANPDPDFAGAGRLGDHEHQDRQLLIRSAVASPGDVW